MNTTRGKQDGVGCFHISPCIAKCGGKADPLTAENFQELRVIDVQKLLCALLTIQGDSHRAFEPSSILRESSRAERSFHLD